MINEKRTFSLPIRVYIEDTDIGGIVFYANYLKYFERARTEFIRSLGFELRSGFEDGVSYVVHSINVRYHAPAKLDEVLQVSAEPVKIGRSFIQFKQQVNNSSGEVLVVADVKVACVSLPSGKPRALPESLVCALNGWQVVDL